MSRPNRPCPGEDGIALIVVLWTLLLLAVIAASLATQARKEGLLARNAATIARIEAAADGGVIRGISALLDPRIEFQWKADSNQHRFTLDGIEVAVTITDEAGKIDLNSGSPELLAAVLQVAGAGESEALSIASAVVRERLGGPKGNVGGIETVADLMLIPGMKRALFERAAPFVTVFTHATGIDPAVAPRAVLIALAGGNAAALAAASASAPESEGGSIAVPQAGGALSESQHAIYAITSVSTVDRASYSRQAIVRLTHSVDIPFLIHAWQRLPSRSIPVEQPRK